MYVPDSCGLDTGDPLPSGTTECYRNRTLKISFIQKVYYLPVSFLEHAGEHSGGHIE